MAKDLYVPAKTETPQIAEDLFSSVNPNRQGRSIWFNDTGTEEMLSCANDCIGDKHFVVCMDVHV